jgi:hypothetical protein
VLTISSLYYEKIQRVLENVDESETEIQMEYIFKSRHLIEKFIQLRHVNLNTTAALCDLSLDCRLYIFQKIVP